MVVAQRKADRQYFRQLLSDLEKQCQTMVASDTDFQSQQKPILLEALNTIDQARQAKDVIQKEFNQLQRQANKAKQQAKQAGGEWKEDPEVQEQLQQLQEKINQAQQVENDKQKEMIDTFQPILEAGIGFFSNKDHQETILKCAILKQASPQYLATFCEEHGEHGANLIWEFLDDYERMKAVMLNGGAKDGKIGDYLLIHEKLNELIPEDDEFQEYHQRLALATALEHAAPMQELDTPEIFVDPIPRFQHYQRAHKNGELDPAFSFLSVWEYRLVVDSNATNDQLQWGRDYLKRFRPNQVVESDRKWRYAMSVKSDVGYRKPNWTSRPKTYQQMVSGGGKCGPRAWYGRYICKAFGIPTWGVRQPGHAAATRWTPHADGWVTLLGAGWHKSNWEGRCGIDFRSEAHARCVASEEDYFLKVTLPESLAVALGENKKPIRQHGNYTSQSFWTCVGAAQRQLYSRAATAEHFARDGVSPAPVKTQIEEYLEALEQKNGGAEPTIDVSESKIVIPANAFASKHATQKHRSFGSDGGFQIMMQKDDSKVVYHLPKNGISSGDYNVTARVCNVHLEQRPLTIKIDGDAEYDVDVPYTVGEWKSTSTTQISLGANGAKIVLKRKDGDGRCFGLAIKEIVLTKVVDSGSEPEYVIVAQEE